LLIRGLYQNYRAGIVPRGQPTFDPVVAMMKTSAGTAEAKVTDCLDDSRAASYYKSGNPTGGEPPGRQRVYAEVQPFDGTWKVTTANVTCALIGPDLARARSCPRHARGSGTLGRNFPSRPVPMGRLADPEPPARQTGHHARTLVA
jgi:hypothetical protein